LKTLVFAAAVSSLAFAQPRTPDLLVRNARVVHGDGRVIPRATVVVSAGRITRVVAGPAIVRARREIDAGGRTLIPGLIDAHVQVRPWALPLLLRAGVTAVRDVHNDRAFIMPLAADDDPDGLRIVAAGAIIDGPGGQPGSVVVETVGDARAAVRDAVRAGAAVISAGPRVHQAMLAVLTAEAAARGVTVAAQLGKTNAVEAADAGITSIEGMSGIADAASDDPERFRRQFDDSTAGWAASVSAWPHLDGNRLHTVARRLLDRDVVLVPTLARIEAVAHLDDASSAQGTGVPREVVEREWNAQDVMRRTGWTRSTLADFGRALPVMERFVADYVRLGGRVAAGTDTPEPFVLPGASLHRELQLYVAGGLSPAAALQAATVNAAALLGISERAGTIAAGKDADFLLLDGDPLRDIRATERIRLIVKRGIVVYER
jgi:hypothetical protein